MKHIHTVLLILYTKTKMETGIAPDLIIHGSCRLLGCQKQMHPKTPSNLCK